jgi:hypothetical protein
METDQEAEEVELQEVSDEESVEQEIEQEERLAAEEPAEQEQEKVENDGQRLNNQGEDRSGFIHGLSVGLGIGCIATFVIIWVSVFFMPQLPSAVTYEGLLSIFIYPLIYLLAVGLIALTAGIVREYYSAKSKF